MRRTSRDTGHRGGRPNGKDGKRTMKLHRYGPFQ